MSDRKQQPGAKGGALGTDFPPLYEQALAAMEQFYAAMNEPWDDPAAEYAFMSYVANDESLMKSIKRIRRRAIRQHRKLLEALEAEKAGPALTMDELFQAMIAESESRRGKRDG